MNTPEILSLLNPEVQTMINTYIDHSPVDLVLTFQGTDLPIALIASQIELLQKAAPKLPFWYEKRCLFTRRALEQCSSEASQRARVVPKGKRALDLTGGLGVDAWFLSRNYDKVDYIEPDPTLSQLARVNFKRLNAPHIQIHATTSESYLSQLSPGDQFDFIFADPDRRNKKGERVAAFTDCQPNVLALVPQLLGILSPGGEIVIKASPMLDISEGRRQLQEIAPWVKAEVISVKNEVKEVLFRIKGEGDPNEDLNYEEKIACHMVGEEVVSFSGLTSKDLPSQPEMERRFLYEADVALYKANLVPGYFNSLQDLPGTMDFFDGYFFSDREGHGVQGKIFKVLRSWPYKPKKIKKELRSLGIEKLNISRRHFNLSTKVVAMQLGVKPGGDRILLCTLNPSGDRWVWLCERIQ